MLPPQPPRRPTLQRLPKTIPVVASPAGAAVARSLGFRTVYSLRAGQSLGLLGGRLTVQGTEGALVGPPWSQRELGVILREGGLREGGASLYYEPHADCLPDSVQRAVAAGGPVDVAVLPPTSQLLLGYPLVRCCRALMPLQCSWRSCRTVSSWAQRS